MAPSRSNLSIYNKVLTEFFKKLLEWNPKTRSLTKNVWNARSFDKIIHILDDDLRKNHPYGTAESNWTALLKLTNQAWMNISTSANDEQALGQLVELYNTIMRLGCYDYVYKELKSQLFNVASSLQLTNSAREILDRFVLPDKSKNNVNVSSSGVFAKPALIKQCIDMRTPKKIAQIADDVENLKSRVTNIEQEVGMTRRVSVR